MVSLLKSFIPGGGIGNELGFYLIIIYLYLCGGKASKVEVMGDGSRDGLAGLLAH